MKKVKLFPKIFIYTFTVMLLITITAHIFIYILAPHMTMSTDNIVQNGTLIENTVNAKQFIKTAILKALPFSLLLCVIIALVCSLLFSKAITRPIALVSAALLQMAALNKAASCPVNSFDEIGILAQNINTLYDRLLSAIAGLEADQKKASEAEKSKIDFLRSASHELKTPVTALSAILENVVLGVTKDKDTAILKCMEITSELSSMIKEILDASKIDFVSEAKQIDTFDLSATLPAFCEPFSLIAKSKQIHFKLNIQSPCRLKLSKKSLEKILSCVISNAVLYTNEKSCVIITLNSKKIIIENECTPLPPEIISHLCEPFYRPDFARNKESGGNGLGLYIADVFAKSMGLSYTFKAINQPRGMQFTLYF